MKTGCAPLSAARIAVLAAATSMLAAGCLWDDDTPRTAAGAPKSPSASSAPQDAGANPLPTKIPNDPDVRANVVRTECEAIPGGWGAKGTAKNPGENPVTYKIIVHFTTTKATTLDYAQTRVTVPPGKTVRWSAEKHFAAKRQMLCPIPGISIVS
ncbi:hypothetical protein [Sphaerisporangium sp. TRM90804]|uniref:hypothetical protein n=1 Tax=Sphaerisporangium sp. TRM90804 TaxID=3031113 RepID=UPI00244702C6|nr:hypothetical protein [Sphaerisporangium sp. TRM90804]MDH2430447.1 hypothetical protein [Sphaerisporangium sp. TRM90804]